MSIIPFLSVKQLREKWAERGGLCGWKGLLIVHSAGQCSLWGTSIQPVSSGRLCVNGLCGKEAFLLT